MLTLTLLQRNADREHKLTQSLVIPDFFECFQCLIAIVVAAAAAAVYSACALSAMCDERQREIASVYF